MVITGLTRNQFARKRTWVRIPSSPPKQSPSRWGGFCFGTKRRDSKGEGVNEAPGALQSRAPARPQARNPILSASVVASCLLATIFLCFAPKSHLSLISLLLLSPKSLAALRDAPLLVRQPCGFPDFSFLSFARFLPPFFQSCPFRKFGIYTLLHRRIRMTFRPHGTHSAGGRQPFG